MSNKKMVPEIRFKGFDEEWVEVELENIADINPKAELPEKFEYVDLDSVLGTELISHREEIKNSAPSRAQRLARKGDLFYQTVRPYQKNNYLFNLPCINYVFSTGYAQLRPNNDGYYLLNLVQTDKFVKSVLDKCTGTSYPAISSKNLSTIKSFCPEDSAQTKIGNYFKDIDSLLNTHKQKYDKLVTLKKAMLEKMFPKEGEDVPEIRFSGFSDKWEVKKIKDVCSVSTGSSNTQDKIVDGTYPFYVRSPIVERSNKFLYDEEAVLTVGDGVGTGKVYHYVNGKYDLHQRVYRMYNFNEVIGKYFYYYFSKYFNDRVTAMTAKTSVDSVRQEMITDMKILYPNIKEQIKIASYFDNLDKLISLQGKQVDKLKKVKKSCLDKMFV